MVDHLSQEEAEKLSKYQLRGKALLKALSHLEDCEECRKKVKSPTKMEIIERLLSDEKPIDENLKPETLSKVQRWWKKIKEYLFGGNNLLVLYYNLCEIAV